MSKSLKLALSTSPSHPDPPAQHDPRPDVPLPEVLKGENERAERAGSEMEGSEDPVLEANKILQGGKKDK